MMLSLQSQWIQIDIQTKPSYNCEKVRFECYRFIPKVIYDVPSGSKRFAAYYKLDYASNTGFTPVHDVDIHGGVDVARLRAETLMNRPFIDKEAVFLGLNNGKPGTFDNIHTGHPMQTVFVPGCRYSTQFDCVHMHWRWSKDADPLEYPDDPQTPVDKALTGTAYLAKDQTIAIAMVKRNLAEQEMDPDDPSTLVNGETIAKTSATNEPMKSVEPLEPCFACELDSAEPTTVWYVASSQNSNDIFFRHGFFVLDTSVTKRLTR